MAERFGLVPTKGALRGDVSIEPGGLSSPVAFLGSHLIDVASHKLCHAHERVW